MSSSTSPSQSPSSGQPQTLDRSQSAPASMELASAPGPCQDPPGLQEELLPTSSEEDAGSTPHHIHPPPLPVPSDSKVPPAPPSPSTDLLRSCSPPADMTTEPQYPEEDQVQADPAEEEAEPDEVMNSPPTLPHPEELSPIQPMEQEAAESDPDAACPSAPGQSDSVEMESPTASQGLVSSERDQPEGEHCSSSDSIPSLAAALMELHELLVSNNRAQSQNRSTSCSPSHPFRQETEEAGPEPQDSPSTAITAGAEPSDAKANHAAAVSDEGPSTCLVPDEHLGGDAAETEGGHGPPQCPGGSAEQRGAERCGQDQANDISSCQPEPEVPPDPAGDLEVREPPEGQQGRGVADGRASGTNTPDTLGLQTEHTFLSPLSMAVGSPEEVSSTSSPSPPPPPAQAPHLTSPAPLLPSPHPFIEQFPAEHIQRIQAAGFSAREAAEALEQAHGVVELALLALLARSITVPT
ncbi:protein DDI1 homolog 2 isoform X2 [Centropristis striata]|nr:protein DDI1 homolog 2 isoform X2 [Centropristis striata]